MPNNNYYKILEINKNASLLEIKKAYKKMAIKWHPDKHKENDKIEAEKKFKEISEAYQILSDPEKKNNYDNYGSSEENNQQQFTNHNDIFEAFFRNQDFMNQESFFNDGFFNNSNNSHNSHNLHNTQKNKNKNNISDTLIKINISLKELYYGSKKKISIKLNTMCIDCEGKGGIIMNCNQCNGYGIIIKTVVLNYGTVQRIQKTCDHCKGHKIIIDEICNSCHGKKIIIKEKSFIITIDAGCDLSDKKRFENSGHENEYGYKSNLLFEFILEKHKYFNIKNKNLIINQDILFEKSLIGTNINFEHINGEKINYFQNSIIRDNSYIIIKNKGLPFKNKKNIYGDLIVVYKLIYDKIDFDENISKRLKNIFSDNEEDINQDSLNIPKLYYSYKE
jgi:DnaJ-class molecular chaperone